MKTFIFIAGAPGVGKSTVARLLQNQLGGPLFEFGWIPEFRHTGMRQTTYQEDETLAFENLTLVAKNYARHGFQNVIITDLENKRIGQLPDVYRDYDYALFTLRLKDEALLKARVLDEGRSSLYRDWQESLRVNRYIRTRTRLAYESFIDVDELSSEQVVEFILTRL